MGTGGLHSEASGGRSHTDTSIDRWPPCWTSENRTLPLPPWAAIVRQTTFTASASSLRRCGDSWVNAARTLAAGPVRRRPTPVATRTRQSWISRSRSPAVQGSEPHHGTYVAVSHAARSDPLRLTGSTSAGPTNMSCARWQSARKTASSVPKPSNSVSDVLTGGATLKNVRPCSDNHGISRLSVSSVSSVPPTVSSSCRASLWLMMIRPIAN